MNGIKNRLLYRCLVLWVSSFLGLFSVTHGMVREAQGVNLTAQEGFGARYFGLSGTALGMRGDETALAYHPAAMKDVSHLWFTAEHVGRFGLANYDNFSATLPLDTATTLGIGMARFGGTFEEYDASNNFKGTRDYYDYLFLLAFAKGWGALDVGTNLKLLYRNVGQEGLGIQGDLSARYTWKLHWSKWLGKKRSTNGQEPHTLYTDFLLKGLIPSSARWESELLEYEPSDIEVGIGYEFYSTELKGEYGVAFQTRGLIQKQARSAQFTRGGRSYRDPLNVLQTMHVGLEGRLDMGMTFRLGMQELGVHPRDFRPTYGVGYHYKGFLSIDYSYHLHPELEHTHRVSLSFSPRWDAFSMTRPGEVRSSIKRIPTAVDRKSTKSVLPTHRELEDDEKNESSVSIAEEFEEDSDGEYEEEAESLEGDESYEEEEELEELEEEEELE